MEIEKESLVLSRQFEKVNAILRKYSHNVDNLIAILQEIQSEYRYLPEEILTYVATALQVSPAHVYGVATFYAQFSLEPKGEHIIRVCDGTACHVKGSAQILKAVRENLGLREGENTTSDLMFTVETVACIGACALAPALMVDEEVYGQMDEEKVQQLVDHLLGEGEKVDAV
ncbi:MAG TPA: NADH-quinone oxidoreductase subunit NuoE [Candidatus Atribacteria bacterium]|jgi:NADH:ubiquinone oxidoreductase subunit E|uniref:NADH-quinone oxidoreductase subunit NuoE n=1 Tax=Candidatus Sordicultor fermentans TaxID=1953203 RepID=UPI0016939710|nr:NADH-quinone oxidoreductase subunit NuoE [Atribacterota bacterium]NLY04669.1 NADH-quinone oxidoreductase subunit NuoE [Candidatus Atribacteria bacterium]MDI9607819.1 NADH-quinone oxidoreductase subunit NuoE [Atribacterota bacterium]MDY0134588.1 NADH-quinone oxidoreductase subunit NuoE [Atribacterota bacterium]HOA98755.1 NADH-quinone oxidoreductase subunit NuoE [Candidatus Atribacteria bacterium]